MLILEDCWSCFFINIIPFSYIIYCWCSTDCSSRSYSNSSRSFYNLSQNKLPAEDDEVLEELKQDLQNALQTIKEVETKILADWHQLYHQKTSYIEIGKQWEDNLVKINVIEKELDKLVLEYFSNMQTHFVEKDENNVILREKNKQ